MPGQQKNAYIHIEVVVHAKVVQRLV